ncbi:MAG: PQQ-dependent sugar dehydrogenase [Myxococcota bacterium]|nr:PQQ-dependent sugar dehydrogenase [Myxococcota bacterium]
MKRKLYLYSCLLLIALIVSPTLHAAEPEDTRGRDAWVPADQIGNLYQEQCEVCHGKSLEGTAQGPALRGQASQSGPDMDELTRLITEGNPTKGMPAWQDTLPPAQIRSLALYILEKSARPRSENDYGLGPLPTIPETPISSEEHDFRFKTRAEDILHPYAIAVLPNGNILLTERTQGLRVLSDSSPLSPPIQGTPRVYTDGVIRGYTYTGLGWLLDVAVHPEYAENGWIYLSSGDRCSDCNALSRSTGEPVSMVALVRGRIQDGKWIDQEDLWKADTASYTGGTELALGARIAFDDQGYVYLTIGAKGDYERAQNLRWPDGKILRLHDDGRIPKDNPFREISGALPEIWTLGHRNPQGLEFDSQESLLWSSEHGPRGGDEGNVILGGRNYGWPRVSLGMEYDGSPIGQGKPHGLDPKTLEGPRIDWTPSLGVSGIDFHSGEAFPKWNHQLLVGTLSRNEVHRVVIQDGEAIHSEVLIRDLGRIRDLAVGPKGHVYLLLEHGQGSRIVELLPVTESESKGKEGKLSP